MKRTRFLLGLLALAAGTLACSRGADKGAGASEVPGADEMAPVFGGFRLLENQEEVLAEAKRDGKELECVLDPAFDAFCPHGLEPAPPGRQALTFGFRGGALVSLARSVGKEARAASADSLLAAYRRAFGAPVLEGWLNPGLHARLWTDPDTTVLAMMACADPADGGTCDLGMDHVPGTQLHRLIADWRAMIDRTAAARDSARAPGAPSDSGSIR